jgi:hypothetical protein
MRNATVTVGEVAEQSFVSTGRTIREIEFTPPEALPIADLVEMYVNIEAALGHRNRVVIQFASMSPQPGGENIACDLAWIGASVLGKRVLLLTSVLPPQAGVERSDKPAKTASFTFSTWNEEFVKLAGYEAYLGNLRGWRSPSGTMVTAAEIDRHLNELSLYFDMVIIAPPPFDQDPLGTVLARHVDGNIIVIEAEQTRRFAAIRLREILTRSGQPIIGAVMAGQKNYLPRWLARLL